MILDGKMLRGKILDELKTKIDKMEVKPTLAVIIAGDNPASKIYVKNKKETAEKIGIKSLIFTYPETVSEIELINKIEELNKDKTIDAILVQLPLPKHISKDNVINAIDPKKDVDGLTEYNFGKLFSGKKPIVYPCTPKGILLLLDGYGIALEGKHAVVIGRSNLVGKPVAQMLLNRNATVTTCHSKTKNLEDIIKTADIVVSAVGKKIVRGKMLKFGSVVIDVGIFKDSTGRTSGDVEYDECSQIASYISPVPGGVGPMTITSLMLNTFELAQMH